MNTSNTDFYRMQASHLGGRLLGMSEEKVNAVPFAQLRLAAKRLSRQARYRTSPLASGPEIFNRNTAASIGTIGQILVTAPLLAAASRSNAIVEPQSWGAPHDLMTPIAGLGRVEIRTGVRRANGFATFAGPNMDKCDSLIMVSLPEAFKAGIDSGETTMTILDKATLREIAKRQNVEGSILGNINLSHATGGNKSAIEGINSLIRQEGTRLGSYAETLEWAMRVA